jgi:hypothetical protein
MERLLAFDGVPADVSFMHWEKWRCLYLFPPAALALAVASAWNVLAAEPTPPGTPLLRYEAPRYLTGSIYRLDSQQLLFKFKRVANRSGSRLNVQRDFTYPDGKLAARERVMYEGDALVSYELDEVQIGANGSATIRPAADDRHKGTIQFEYRKEAGSRPKARDETLRQITLMADMVGPFLASHWDALERGEKVQCRYIVVPRAETVGFTFLKDSEIARGAPDALIVKMEPSSRFIAALVDPLFFTIEKAPPHRVLQYVGRTTPKIQVGARWRDLDAVTVFDWESTR